MPDRLARPRAASEYRSLGGSRRITGAGMIIVYVVLLFAVPSNVIVGGMGSLGRPALLWGLVLLLWWLLLRLQARPSDVAVVPQPVRWALGAFVVIVLVSFAAAMLRGQPADQVSPAATAVIRVASWSGVVLVTMDGVRTRNDIVRIVRTLVVAAGCVSVLGIAQFVTGSSLLEWLGSVPGLAFDWGGLDARGGYVRASGTATHPLEFVSSLAAILPLALALAIMGGGPGGRTQARGWVIVGLILAVCLTAVSRSAIIGLVIAFVLFLPWMPRAYRLASIAAGLVISALVVVVVPGMLSTTLALFTNVADDSSTHSRTDALSRVPDFLATSPLIGQGWGTFMSRYYIFDNQWVGIVLEVGIVGTLIVLAVLVCALWSAIGAAWATVFADTRLIGGAVAAGLAVCAVSFLFFDALGFTISAGVFWLLVGLAAALRTIAAADRAFALAPVAEARE